MRDLYKSINGQPSGKRIFVLRRPRAENSLVCRKSKWLVGFQNLQWCRIFRGNATTAKNSGVAFRFEKRKNWYCFSLQNRSAHPFAERFLPTDRIFWASKNWFYFYYWKIWHFNASRTAFAKYHAYFFAIWKRTNQRADKRQNAGTSEKGHV